MNWLLSKKDEERLMLHRYLMTHHSRTFLIKDLMTAVNWSRYRILQAIQQLNIDYQSMTKSKQTFIKVTDANRTVTLTNLQLIGAASLKGFYLRQSLRFEMLLDIFLEDIHSNEAIAFRHSSSTTVVRMTKEAMRTELREQGIDISDNYQLIGDEQQIRTAMIELIYLAYADQSLPFSSATNRAITQVQQNLVPLLTKRLTMQRILAIVFGVWYTRVQNGHHIEPMDDDLLRPTKDLQDNVRNLLNQMAPYLQKYFQNDQLGLDIELRYGVLVCYALGIGDASDYLVNLTAKNQHKVTTLFDQIAYSYQNFFKHSMPTSQRQAMVELLTPLLIRLTYFPPQDNQLPTDMAFQTTSYPIHTAFTKIVIQKLAQVFQYDTSQLLGTMFNPLLNAFIKTISVKDVLPAITITIDLIDMPALEDYLTQMVQQWQSLNISVTNEFTDKTDIYLSNVILSQEVPGFAWYTIPEWSERLALRQLIIDITLNRFQNKKSLRINQDV